MTNKDYYYNKAKQEGYRTRAAYKLIQLADDEALFDPGDVVVDLGGAPGGWMQVAAEAVGETGMVVGVDIQGIDPLEEVQARTVRIRGDISEEETIDEVCARLPSGNADVVISDMAPEMSGEYNLDQARSLHLAEQAFGTATTLLSRGGHFVVKVFQGHGVDAYRDRLEETFEFVRTTSPDASRESSAEIYFVAKRFVNVPVRSGQRRTVEITDMGSEGDGIATIEGYTVFVPGTAVGDHVEIEITDTKAQFGFAEAVE